MGLLRATGVPRSFLGFTIDKARQMGDLTGMADRLAPRQIIHSEWKCGSSSDGCASRDSSSTRTTLRSLQRRFPVAKRSCGFGVATPVLSAPEVKWRGVDTFIRKEGIVGDFRSFDDPDAFYSRHGANLSGPRRWLFVPVVRQRMNATVARIRASRW